jgi:tetrahydromethanopterin S-methyltransferase subunit E
MFIYVDSEDVVSTGMCANLLNSLLTINILIINTWRTKTILRNAYCKYLSGMHSL